MRVNQGIDMQKINDGGLAFPATESNGLNSGVYGLSMRDYFAAKAMPAVYADYCAEARQRGFNEGWRHGVAIDTYAMADAMLAAREWE